MGPCWIGAKVALQLQACAAYYREFTLDVFFQALAAVFLHQLPQDNLLSCVCSSIARSPVAARSIILLLLRMLICCRAGAIVVS